MGFEKVAKFGPDPLDLPREGHLYQVFQMFGYSKKYHSTEMVFDPSNPVVN